MSAWTHVALGEVAAISRIGADPRTLVAGTKYVGLEDISSGGSSVHPVTLGNGDVASTKFRFTEHHLLFGKLRPYLAKIVSVDFAGVCSTDILPILPGPRIDREYLRHYLLQPSMVAYTASLATGANLPRLSPAALMAIRVPLPPFHEQRRIADILDRADTLRTKRRQTLAQLDAIRQSIFIAMFGDPVSNPKGWQDTRTIGDVAEITSGVTKGRKLNGAPTRNVPYLSVVNVQDGRLDLNAVKKIEATEAEIDRFHLERGDLLLTEGGDPDKLGRGCLWSEELPESIHQNHIFRVRLRDSDLTPIFLNWLVGSERGKRYFLRSAKQTTGIATINLGQLRAFPLLIPPLALQKEFGAIVDRVAIEKKRLRTSMQGLEALFTSLQHSAFQGRV